jgi:hypothetical protein
MRKTNLERRSADVELPPIDYSTPLRHHRSSAQRCRLARRPTTTSAAQPSRPIKIVAGR